MAVEEGCVVIYADGACKGNPGPGGWGAWLAMGGHEKEMCGGELLTTNNRMELTAVIRALQALKRPCQVKIYTDSVYVQKGITEWMTGWKARNWRTSDKKPVKNEWPWRKGHAGNAGNERADALANQGVLQALEAKERA